ncbi:hypothetical protein J6590_025157, partial [Homalodisca vitripennis]
MFPTARIGGLLRLHCDRCTVPWHTEGEEQLFRSLSLPPSTRGHRDYLVSGTAVFSRLASQVSFVLSLPWLPLLSPAAGETSPTFLEYCQEISETNRRRGRGDRSEIKAL